MLGLPLTNSNSMVTLVGAGGPIHIVKTVYCLKYLIPTESHMCSKFNIQGSDM